MSCWLLAMWGTERVREEEKRDWEILKLMSSLLYSSFFYLEIESVTEINEWLTLVEGYSPNPHSFTRSMEGETKKRKERACNCNVY